MPTPEQWQEYAAQRNKYRYGTPEQSVDPSTRQDSSLIDKARLTLGGIGLDPKAAPLPNETVPSYMGRRLRESYTDTVAPIASMVVGVKEPIGQFTSNLTGDVAKVVRPAPTPLEAVSTSASVPTPVPVTPMLTSLGNGYGVAGANTSGRAGYSNRTYYDPSGNVIGSGISSATGRGGFVGAATDAEANRNLKARFEQDAAASAMAASMNRGAEAMRELRAAQVADFDGYKPGMPAVPGQLDSPNPLSMPGDSIQDTRGRQAEYDQAVEAASTGNMREKKGAAATLTALNDLMEKNLAAQVAKEKGQTGVDPIDMNKFLLDRERFNYQQNTDNNKFLLDQEKLRHQQNVDKQRLTFEESDARGKQSARQLEKQKHLDESRKTFVNEFSFSDPNAPKDQIAGAIFDISLATGVPTDVVSQFYEQVVKDLKIDYGKGGPKDPMALNKLVAARITQAYQDK